MNCPICKAPITMQDDRCGNCGRSMNVYKKVVRISNTLYNRGLEKAKIRDLSGAIDDLNLSLKYYKRNTDARNLLGLVYCEIGETVMALTQWILSKNLQPEDNEADYFIESIHSNGSLDTINQTIKKYNAALNSARQGNDDLAIIQLKKVVSLNPRFVKAHQLLALMYMIGGQKELAVKVLKAIKPVDINNTATIRYLKELGVRHVSASRASSQTAASGDRKVFHGDSGVVVKEVGTYKTEKPRIYPFVNVIIGVIIGLLVGVVLISPTIAGRINSDKNSEVTEYGEKLAAKDKTISDLQFENKNLNSQISQLQKSLEEATTDDSLSLAETYEKIMDAYKSYNEDKKSEALAMISGLDVSGVENETVKSIITLIQSEDAHNASAEMFEKGRVSYNIGNYDEALNYLTEAINLNSDNYDAIYFLGRLYHKQGNSKKAESYYRKVINNYPDSPRASEAKSRLSELGISVDTE